MQTYSNSTTVCWSEAQWIFMTSLTMALISDPPVWTTTSHSDMRLLALNHFSEEDATVKEFMWRHSKREKFKKSKKNIRERWGMLYLCGSGVCVRGFHFCKPPPCKEKTKQDVKHVTHLRSFKFTHEDFPPLRAFPRHTYWAHQRSVASPSSRLK